MLMSRFFYDVVVGVMTLELMTSMLYPCSDVATLHFTYLHKVVTENMLWLPHCYCDITKVVSRL